MNQKKTLNIVVADDQDVDVEGLQKMISDAEDMQVIAQIQDLTRLTGVIEQRQPDVVVLDIDWFGDHTAGTRKIRELKETYPQLAIVGVTVYPQLVVEASQAGVLALKKNFTRRELWASIHQAYEFRESKHPNRMPPPGFEELTPRELEVLGCLVRARTDEQIALELKIKVGTVKKHVGHILDKLNVASRTEAAILAERSGFHSVT